MFTMFLDYRFGMSPVQQQRAIRLAWTCQIKSNVLLSEHVVQQGQATQEII